MHIRWNPSTILAAAVTVLVLAAVLLYAYSCGITPDYADTIGLVCP